MFFHLMKYLLFALSFTFVTLTLYADNFEIVSKQQQVSIYYHPEKQRIDSLMAQFLARDIEKVSGVKPKIITDISLLRGNVIFLTQVDEHLPENIKTAYKSDLTSGDETFSWDFLSHPTPKINQVLLITGSDDRGLAYGVFKLSKQIGVNPWYWWADVPIHQNRRIQIPNQHFLSSKPSVKYRGIFVNDEDWGLRPWASGNMDSKLHNIGPKTYEKVFELLLRLNANMIWPAMHPGTKAFFKIPENLAVARKFHIIIGTSHAEPMLRNNVDEWNEKTMGAFNYLTNREKVLNYWDSRIKESKQNEVIYTMGMRGVHDSGMEGVKSSKEAVPVLEQVIKDQRKLLHQDLKKENIPQALVLYKEVLDVYDKGLKVPDDVTLVWPDDNYGYIRRLNDDREKLRSGGSGVYYHDSYWGRPHDYLWLSTTAPALIREEMLKAYHNQSDRLWVLNVGDIKPAEYQLQLFMDMAYSVKPFEQEEYLNQHLQNWYSSIFRSDGKTIAHLYQQYYQLAWERRPEFMGWSQTEPTTATHLTAYNHFYNGDEAQKRMDAYRILAQKTDSLYNHQTKELKNSFFELVAYPMIASAEMNMKFLYRDKAEMYHQQGRLSATQYADSVHQVYQNIVKLTSFYNDSLASGKWHGEMSMSPRNLPVFDDLKIAFKALNNKGNWGLVAEGDTLQRDTSYIFNLYEGDKSCYFFDIFLKKNFNLDWKIIANRQFSFSKDTGVLKPNGKLQERIWVSLNPDRKVLKNQTFTIQISTNDGIKYVKINVFPRIGEKNEFIENNGLVSIFASHYTEKNGTHSFWKPISGLGYTGKVLCSFHENEVDKSKSKEGILNYRFEILNTSNAKLLVYTVPTHALNANFHLRYAIKVDDGEWQIINFETYNRSEVWKQNVLSNSAMQLIKLGELKKGRHNLQIKAIDPEVLIDRMMIDLGGYQSSYDLLAETKN